MPSPSPSLADIEAQLQRLRAERETLEQQRQLARVEELKVLADAYARKLNAAGFSVKDGIAALKPYANVRLNKADAAPAPSSSAAAPAPRQSVISPAPVFRPSVKAATSAPQPAEDLNSRAAQVLGDDAPAWLRRPHALLGGQSPQQVAGMPGGMKKVVALLAAYARGA